MPMLNVGATSRSWVFWAWWAMISGQSQSVPSRPVGPCCSFATPSGHRVAIYELSRPEVAKHFDGRYDF